MCDRFVKRFTLVEMLVVIAIIAILAGLLVGPLLKSSDSSRLTSCINLVGQYARASMQYTQNNDGMLIDAYNYLSASGGLPEYLSGTNKVTEAYTRCPADAQTETLGRLYDISKITQNKGGAKEYNGVIYKNAEDSDALRISIGAIEFTMSTSLRPANTDSGYLTRWNKVGMLKVPSRHGMFADFQMSPAQTGRAAPIVAPSNTATALMGNMVFRHMDMNTTVSYADGHAARAYTTLPTINQGHDFASSVAYQKNPTDPETKKETGVYYWGGDSPSPGREFEPLWGPSSNTYSTGSSKGVYPGLVIE